jgi:hypothetical protein
VDGSKQIIACDSCLPACLLVLELQLKNTLVSSTTHIHPVLVFFSLTEKLFKFVFPFFFGSICLYDKHRNAPLCQYLMFFLLPVFFFRFCCGVLPLLHLHGVEPVVISFFFFFCWVCPVFGFWVRLSCCWGGILSGLLCAGSAELGC